jgi:hypothetical protein
MDEHNDLPAQIQGVIESYLDDKESFEAAADRLAALLRNLAAVAKPVPTVHLTRIRVKPLSLNEWLDPRSFDAPAGKLNVVALAPGRPPEDESKAQALFDAACRRVGDVRG